MISLEKINNLKSEKVGFFRFKKFDETTYLITNDIGEYAFLTKEEFGDFVEGKLKIGDKYEELIAKKFLKGETYDDDMAVDYGNMNQFLAHGLATHILVTTLRCNHKCRYCHSTVASVTEKNMDMNVETARKVVDTIFCSPSNNLTIEFQGGESLMNWDVVKYIVEYATQKSLSLRKRITFSLVSNLTLMDDEKMEYLLQHEIDVCTSLDGDEDTHNFNRTFKYGNSYEQVTYWVNRFNEEYKKKGKNKVMKAVLTVTRKTLGRYKEAIDAYVSLGFGGISLRPLNPYGFAAVNMDKLGYTTEEYIEFYNNSMDYIFELNRKGILFFEEVTCTYLRKILKGELPIFGDERSPCGACVSQVAYNYDGKVYSCDDGRLIGRMGDDNFMMLDLNEISFDIAPGYEAYNRMVNSNTTKIMVQASTLDGLPGYNDSVYKPYLSVCPIHSYKMTGNIMANYAKDSKKKLDYALLDSIFTRLRNKEDKLLFDVWMDELGRRDGPPICNLK